MLGVATMILVGLASAGSTAPQAKGGITVYDQSGMLGIAARGDSAKVTVAFSIAITGLTPNSTTSQLFVTDKDAQPDIVYGPITIPNVDGQGFVCMEVENAPPGTWKIDVVEEGSGFTDSKVFNVEAPEPTTTTSTATTTTTAPTTTRHPLSQQRRPPCRRRARHPQCLDHNDDHGDNHNYDLDNDDNHNYDRDNHNYDRAIDHNDDARYNNHVFNDDDRCANHNHDRSADNDDIGSVDDDLNDDARETTTTTSSAEAIHLPGSELPWVIVFDPPAQAIRQPRRHRSLPRTGANAGAAVALGSGLVGIGLALRRAGRRR